jgi:hypothetical protein
MIQQSRQHVKKTHVSEEILRAVTDYTQREEEIFRKQVLYQVLTAIDSSISWIARKMSETKKLNSDSRKKLGFFRGTNVTPISNTLASITTPTLVHCKDNFDVDVVDNKGDIDNITATSPYIPIFHVDAVRIIVDYLPMTSNVVSEIKVDCVCILESSA